MASPDSAGRTGSVPADSGASEAAIAILTAHASFSERVTAHLLGAGLPCVITRVASDALLRETLEHGEFEAVLVDHRLPYRWGQRADALVGYSGIAIAITPEGESGSVHPRFDRVVAMGDVRRLAVILATLTERRRAFAEATEREAARQKAERRLSLLQEVATTAVLCVGGDGTIESIN
jgi:hypothetical protein